MQAVLTLERLIDKLGIDSKEQIFFFFNQNRHYCELLIFTSLPPERLDQTPR